MQINTHQALDSQAPFTAQSRQAQITPPVEESRKDANPNAQEPRAVRSATPTDEGRRLSDAEQRQIQELKARDREVRAHEQAHREAAARASIEAYEQVAAITSDPRVRHDDGDPLTA